MNDYQMQRTIVEWLQEYDAMEAGITNLKEQITDIAEEGMGINCDKEPSSKTNKFSSIVENAVVRIDKLDIKRRIRKMENIINSVDKAISVLNNTEKLVITNRCMKQKYYYQFCGDIQCSERTAKRIKKEALKKMVIVIFGKR